uniref:Uncharacterized protein n=1 Tax=Megaviridae environmental sample TaxID=1737588 RepID=A0A5J6VHU9_9VIRU|nr:MAG: hypothetical protein [Megaviridae environmental sample]
MNNYLKYKHKYIKYKHKYLELKNTIYGGTSSCFMPHKTYKVLESEYRIFPPLIEFLDKHKHTPLKELKLHLETIFAIRIWTGLQTLSNKKKRNELDGNERLKQQFQKPIYSILNYNDKSCRILVNHICSFKTDSYSNEYNFIINIFEKNNSYYVIFPYGNVSTRESIIENLNSYTLFINNKICCRNDIYSVIRSLLQDNCKSIYLCGHSMGAVFAQYVAAKFYKNKKIKVLCSGGYCFLSLHEKQFFDKHIFNVHFATQISIISKKQKSYIRTDPFTEHTVETLHNATDANDSDDSDDADNFDNAEYFNSRIILNKNSHFKETNQEYTGLIINTVGCYNSTPEYLNMFGDILHSWEIYKNYIREFLLSNDKIPIDAFLNAQYNTKCCQSTNNTVPLLFM